MRWIRRSSSYGERRHSRRRTSKSRKAAWSMRSRRIGSLRRRMYDAPDWKVREGEIFIAASESAQPLPYQSFRGLPRPSRNQAATKGVPEASNTNSSRTISSNKLLPDSLGVCSQINPYFQCPLQKPLDAGRVLYLVMQDAKPHHLATNVTVNACLPDVGRLSGSQLSCLLSLANSAWQATNVL